MDLSAHHESSGSAAGSIASPADTIAHNHAAGALVRACRNCAAAKTKCVAGSAHSGGDCERCHRLKKACTRDTPKVKKRKPPTANSLVHWLPYFQVTCQEQWIETHADTRNARLEQKLDQLVTLLANGHQRQSSSSATPEAQHTVHTVQSTPNHHSSDYETRMPPRGQDAGAHASQPPPTPCEPIELDPEDKDVDIRLHHYQAHLAPQFPFVVIPSGTTVAQMRKEKPFLLRVIVTVASIQDLVRRKALVEEVLKDIAHRLLVQGEKSLDLLQGILVFAAWYHHHLFTKPQMTNLLQLAIGLVIDLGLKKSARAYGNDRLESSIARSAHGEESNSEICTSEQRRAFLGCFYLTTILAQWAKRYDSLRYSAQLDQCCRQLEEAQEYPSDRFLVHLVRLQRIVQRIERKVPIDDLTPETTIPIAMFVKSLHGELLEYKNNLPQDMAKDPSILLHYDSAEVYLYEISLSSLPSTSQYGDYTYRRLDLLNACMLSAKQLFSHFTSKIPAALFAHMPFLHFSHMTSAVVALSKLMRLDWPGWDKTYAQSTISLSALIETAAQRFDAGRAEAAAADGPLADNPLLTVLGRKMRFVALWNECKIKGIEHVLPPRGTIVDDINAQCCANAVAELVRKLELRVEGAQSFLEQQQPRLQTLLQDGGGGNGEVQQQQQHTPLPLAQQQQQAQPSNPNLQQQNQHPQPQPQPQSTAAPTDWSIPQSQQMSQNQATTATAAGAFDMIMEQIDPVFFDSFVMGDIDLGDCWDAGMQPLATYWPPTTGTGTTTTTGDVSAGPGSVVTGSRSGTATASAIANGNGNGNGYGS